MGPVEELCECECAAAARKLVELHPNFREGTAEADVARWSQLYVPSGDFDLDSRVDYRESSKSTTFLDSGTFCDVHVDLTRPLTHVVSIARYCISGTTATDSDDAATYEHYANTLDAAVRIREVSKPDREPRWAAVPEGFTVLVDEDDGVWFVFLAVRHIPLLEHPTFLDPKKNFKELRRLMWHLAVSAWFVENVAGLAHRDIKPANVLVTQNGAVLADFGSARPMGCRGNPAFYLNPPWMDLDELMSVIKAKVFTWTPGSCTYGIGMIMLRGVWGRSKFNTVFPQHIQKRWPHKIALGRKVFNEKLYRACVHEAAEKGSSLESAALMLANPDKAERSNLMYIERMLRPDPLEPESLLMHLPSLLQRSGDVAV